MRNMGFVGDLINRPEAAIETIKEKRTKWKWGLLIVLTGMLLMTNFFFYHFTANVPQKMIFGLMLGVVGIIIEFGFILGFGVNLYFLFKLTKYEPAGETSRIVMWCALIPSFIFHLGLFLVGNFLIAIGMIEVTGYLYDTLKFLLYIWIIGLSIVAVMQNNPKHKFKNILVVIGAFALLWAVWNILVSYLLTYIFTTFA